MADLQRQELNCTNCNRVFRFDLDFEKDGNHEITCPGCRHVHYRVIRNGRITEVRWRPLVSLPTYTATNYYMSNSTGMDYSTGATSTGTGATSTGTGYTFLMDSWYNSSTTY